MPTDIQIDQTPYTFACGYKDDDSLRMSFNDLAMQCFEFELEDFYREGYWNDSYIPYSLIADDRIVSNVSVFDFDFVLNHKTVKCVQIATVMTDDRYRGRGLSRYLLERVLHEWKNECDMIYLFANDTAVGLYPRFGFVPAREYVHYKELHPVSTVSQADRLNMENETDRRFVFDYIENAFPVAELSSLNTSSLVMYHCMTSQKSNVYYVNQLDAVVIAQTGGEVLCIHDVFCKKQVGIDDVIQKMASTGVQRAVLGFTPLDKSDFEKDELKVENSTLFILENKKEIFQDHEIRFPVLTRT